MKTIVPAKENIAKLWGHPKPKEDVQYRPMKYLLKTQVEDGTLLYNVVTSEMVLLDEAETRLFEALPSGFEPLMTGLISEKFIVPLEYDEYKSVNQLRIILRKLKDKGVVNGFTILPTTYCNAHCYYCFESDYPRQHMTVETADAVIEYIIRYSKNKPVTLEWFGGEPLVAQERITQICSGLSERNVEFKSIMVSNAYLFSKDTAQFAKECWKLKSIQITLDGTEQVYNEAKAYQGVFGSPFQQVINNIGYLLEAGIVVNVRLNTTESNIDNLFELADELSERFGEQKGFNVYCHMVYDDVGFSPLHYTENGKKNIVVRTIGLRDRLVELGLFGEVSSLPKFKLNRCMSDSDSNRVIYPDGRIGKCENSSVNESVGDIYRDVVNIDKYDSYKLTITDEKCRECPLYPSCVYLKVCPEHGGCMEEEKKWKIIRYSDMLRQSYKRPTEDTEADNECSD